MNYCNSSQFQATISKIVRVSKLLCTNLIMCQQKPHHLKQTQQTTPQQQTPAPAPLPQDAPQQPRVVGDLDGKNNARKFSDHQKELRHKQQRLLLLKHAAQCQHEDGHCQVTRHCAGMRRLWMHIGNCNEKQCLVPHCVSSRYILSHYHRCKDFRCPVCGPVRKAIHRDHVVKQKQKEADVRAHTMA